MLNGAFYMRMGGVGASQKIVISLRDISAAAWKCMVVEVLCPKFCVVEDHNWVRWEMGEKTGL